MHEALTYGCKFKLRKRPLLPTLLLTLLQPSRRAAWQKVKKTYQLALPLNLQVHSLLES